MQKYFKVIFDENDLGDEWMNIHNLKLCLYSDAKTKEELCQVEDFTEKIQQLEQENATLQGNIIKIEKIVNNQDQENERLKELIKKALNEIPPNPKSALTIIIREILEKALEE